MPFVRVFLLIVVSLGLASCSSLGALGVSKSDEAFLSTPIYHEMNDNTAFGIWQIAELARADNNYLDAMDYYLQALDRLPNDPVVLSRVAEMHMRMNNLALTEKSAVQSNRNSSDKGLLFRNWMMIRYVRESQGDLAGVKAAEAEIEAIVG